MYPITACSLNCMPLHQTWGCTTAGQAVGSGPLPGLCPLPVPISSRNFPGDTQAVCDTPLVPPSPGQGRSTEPTGGRDRAENPPHFPIPALVLHREAETFIFRHKHLFFFPCSNPTWLRDSAANTRSPSQPSFTFKNSENSRSP